MDRRGSWDYRVVSGPAVLRIRTLLDRQEAKMRCSGTTAAKRETMTGRIRTLEGHRRAVTGQNHTVITRTRTVVPDRETQTDGIRTLAGHRRAVVTRNRAVLELNRMVEDIGIDSQAE